MGYIFDALNRQKQAQDEAGGLPEPTPSIFSDAVKAHALEEPDAPQTPAFSLFNAIKLQPLEPVETEEPSEPQIAQQPTNEPETTAPPTPVSEDPPVVEPLMPQPEPAASAPPPPPPVAPQEPRLSLAGLHQPPHWEGEQWMQRIDDRLVTLTDPACPTAEEYRSIRTSLLARHQRARNLTHVITSATPQEGKTLTTVNLGFAFAELQNRRTIIIEADLRLPNFDRLLNLQHNHGLLGTLRGEFPLEQAIQVAGPNHLHIIGAGGRTTNDAVQLLSSQRMAEIIHRLREEYDHVFIDTPPVVELADAGILGALADEVMLIARMRRTPKQLIEQAVRTLASYHAPLAGVLATDNRPRLARGYYRYGYRYGYSYHRSRKNPSARKRAA